MQNSNVTAEYTLKFEQVRAILLERLTQHSTTLESFISNGMGGDSTQEWCNRAGSGVCHIINNFVFEINTKHPRLDEVAFSFHRACHEVIGMGHYPLNVVPTIKPHNQFLYFGMSVRRGKLVRLTRDQFNDYANARIELIARVVEGVKNVRIG